MVKEIAFWDKTKLLYAFCQLKRVLKKEKGWESHHNDNLQDYCEKRLRQSPVWSVVVSVVIAIIAASVVSAIISTVVVAWIASRTARTPSTTTRRRQYEDEIQFGFLTSLNLQLCFIFATPTQFKMTIQYKSCSVSPNLCLFLPDWALHLVQFQQTNNTTASYTDSILGIVF